MFSEENKRWPTKKSLFECNQTPEGTYICETIGLGEPFPKNEGPSVGIGCELWCEVENMDDAHFAVCALREVAEGIISSQDIISLVKKYKYVPLDLEQREVPYPDGFREYQERQVGVLLGTPVPSHRREYTTKTNSANKDIPRICVKILTRTQLLRIRAGGSRSCKKLVGDLVKSKEFHITKITS